MDSGTKPRLILMWHIQVIKLSTFTNFLIFAFMNKQAVAVQDIHTSHVRT